MGGGGASSGPSAAPPCRSSQRKLVLALRIPPAMSLAYAWPVFSAASDSQATPIEGSRSFPIPQPGLIPPTPHPPVFILASRSLEGLRKGLKLRGVGAADGGGSRDRGLGSCPACSCRATWQRGLSRLPALLRKRVGKRLTIINTWGAFCLRSALQTRPN